MGVRIVVVFQQDLAHLWSQDPKLGKKILSQVHGVSDMPETEIDGGKVVEIAWDHAQSLLAFDSEGAHKLTYSHSKPGKPAQINIELLRTAAKILGYSLVKKAARGKDKKAL